MSTFLVEPGEQGERADLFLSRKTGESRSRVQRAFDQGTVTCGTRSEVRPKDEVQAGEQWEIAFAPSFVVSNEPPPSLGILYEDHHLIVVEKPAGLLTHPMSEDDPRPSVSSLLVAQYPQIAQVGEHALRPGIVHRLDKEASGALVVAKTPEAFTHLKACFQERRVHKVYLALTHGVVKADRLVRTEPIGRAQDGKMRTFPIGSPLGREALTEADVLRRFDHASLLRITIHTGRTHQIRVHLRGAQHPLFGDRLYTHPKGSDTLPRLFLHAHELGFPLLGSNEQRLFVSPLPSDLISFLENL